MIKGKDFSLTVLLEGKDVAFPSSLGNLIIHLPGGLDLPYLEFSLKLTDNYKNYINKDCVVTISSGGKSETYKFVIYKQLIKQGYIVLFGIAFYKEMSDSKVDYSDSTSIEAIKKFASSLHPRVEGTTQDEQVWIKSISLRYTLELIWKHHYIPNDVLLFAIQDHLIVRPLSKARTYKYKAGTVKGVDFLTSQNLTVESLPLSSMFSTSISQIKLEDLSSSRVFVDVPEILSIEKSYEKSSLVFERYISDNVHLNYNKAFLQNKEILSRGFKTQITISEFVNEVQLLDSLLLVGYNEFINGVWIVTGKDYKFSGSSCLSTLHLWRDS